LVGLNGYFATQQLKEENRILLSCATRQASVAKQPLKITSFKEAVEFADRHSRTRVSVNIDRLLQYIAEDSKRPAGRVRFRPDLDFTVIDCYSKAEFEQYITWAGKSGLIQWAWETVPGPVGALVRPANATILAVLTMEGWNQVQPLPRSGGIPGRCFVAMWFSDETRAVYESGIRPAIADAGFEPIRIDQKEHNNEIPDEIMAEIRNCQFMVADFTGQRAGVYYEAGFATGLGRPVVWCCREDEIGNLHFDTNHKNHIAWRTPEELRKRLHRRIRSTIFEQG
jgi:nucleoside 2-deoxyribosyltransferase